MASFGRKVFLSLGRTNVSGVGIRKTGNRATYATALTVNSSSTNKGEFVSGNADYAKRSKELLTLAKLKI